MTQGDITEGVYAGIEFRNQSSVQAKHWGHQQ
jgi:hypothetical protein